MRDDAPAALPLIAFAAGLAIPLVNPLTAIVLLSLWSAAVLSRAARVRAPALHRVAIFLALGLFVATHEHSRRTGEARAFASLDADSFANVTAPIDRDWSARGTSFMLRAHSFRVNGTAIDQPLLVYLRATPPSIGNETAIRARGFLRRNERGAYTMTVKSPALLRYEGGLSAFSPARWNRALTRRVEAYAATFPTEVALIEAIALGRGERLDDEVRGDFKRGGTYHLLVFSGLQIALAAASMALLLRWLGMPRVSDVSLLVFAVIAPLFAGPSASVVRASIAIGLYAVSRMLQRPTSLENLWALSALVRLILVPAELTDAGFHLTYAGAGALLFLARGVPKRIRWLAGAAAAEAAVTPLTLFHFHQYAIGGSLATIVMTPLIFVMLIASVAAIAMPCAALFLLIRMLHVACTAINAAGAGTSGFFAAPPLVAMIIGFSVAAMAIAIAHRGRRTIIAMGLLIPTAAAIGRQATLRSVDQPELTFLDVGQGDAILARDGDHTLLVDGGGRADDARFGEGTLLPMLVDRGVQHIDAIVLSHVHPDHCGGLPSVIRHLRVGELWISPRQFQGICAQQLLAATLDRHLPIHLVRDGDVRWIGSFRLTTRVASRTYRRAPENNSSVVLRLRAARLTALLTGDIERETEGELGPTIGRAEILKVAHHGSRSSTTPAFLDAVGPRIGVISCGRHNLFGHPHPAVIATLRSRRIQILRTDVNGTITMRGSAASAPASAPVTMTGSRQGAKLTPLRAVLQ